MSKNLIYGILTFFLGSVGVCLGSQAFALNISELGISGDGVRAFGQAYGNLNNNSVSTCSGNSDCNMSYQFLYDDMCYIWAGNGKYYTPTISNYYTVINTSACQSPITIGGYYYGGGSRDPRAEFSIQLDYGNYSAFVPGVSFTNNGEGVDFGYIRGSQGKVVYSVPSRAGFVVEYGGNTYTMTKVFIYPNRFIFSTSDGSFMFEVGAGGTVVNGFFVIDPSAVSNNLYFVDSVQQKAWSTTINSDLARDLLLGNTAYWTIFSGGNFGNIFDTSYTLSTVAGGSIFPSGFGPGYQDTSFGFSYQEDLDFVPPSSGSGNNSGSGSGNNSGSGTGGNSIIQQEYLSCVGKYGYISQLSQELQNLKNGIGVDYDYTGYLNIYEWAASFDGSYTGLDVQINNIVLDKTFVSSVNHVWEISQGSPHTYVYYFNQAVSNITNPSNIITIYCGENPLPNASDMLYFDDPYGDSDQDSSWCGIAGTCDCERYDIACNMGLGQFVNNKLEKDFNKVLSYLNILFNKIIDPITTEFNNGLAFVKKDTLLCGNNGFTLPIIDYIQYLLIMLLIFLFVKIR